MKAADRIKGIVAKELEIPMRAMDKRDRHARVKFGRSLAMYFCMAKIPVTSLREVGTFFGKPFYSAPGVHAAVVSIQERLRDEPQIAQLIAALEERIGKV